MFFVMTGVALAGTITVTSPRAGEVLYKDRTYTIAWTSSGKVGRVMVRLMRGRIAAVNLSLNTENDGSFEFPVPNKIREGEFTIEVQNTSRSVKGESGIFRIIPNMMAAPPPPLPLEIMPTITITSPVDSYFFDFYVGGDMIGSFGQHADVCLQRSALLCIRVMIVPGLASTLPRRIPMRASRGYAYHRGSILIIEQGIISRRSIPGTSSWMRWKFRY